MAEPIFTPERELTGLSVILPALNEAAGISETIHDLAQALEKAPVAKYEIIVVDDGSNDNTQKLALESGARVVAHVCSMGYGYSLKDGIRHAKYDTIAILDADGTYPPAALPEMLEIYTKGYNLIVGQRQGIAYRQSFFKWSLRRIFRFIAEFTTGTSVPDINSGLRVFNRTEIMAVFPQLCNTFSFTTTLTLTYELTNKSIYYYPIDYSKRYGKSKVRLFRDSIRSRQLVLNTILHYNPLKAFLLMAIFLLISSFMTIVINIPFQSLFIFLAGTFQFLGSIILLGLGLIAEQLRQIMQSLDNNASQNKNQRTEHINGK